MRERPILFNAEMVRAIIDGRKTQTRRVVKRIAGAREFVHRNGDITDAQETLDAMPLVEHMAQLCSYGVPGDRLWVRETWACVGLGLYAHRATDGWKYQDIKAYTRRGWRPSIHMPRRICRLVLEVTGVRVERLQRITYGDALAEGVWRPAHDADPDKVDREYDAVVQFRELWDGINAKRGYGWSRNPWVWVLEFKIAEFLG